MEHLKELRAKKNMLQKDVAEILKIDRTTYAKYETGDSEPSFEILKRIALFYDVTTDYLLGFDRHTAKNQPENEKELLTPEEEKLIEQFRTLNKQGREFILQVMVTAVSSEIYKNHQHTSGMENQMS